MLILGVIMSGDTGEQVCVLQNASSARRKRKVHIFMMKRCRQCALMFGILHSKEVLAETCASWGGVAPGLARQRCSSGDLS